MAVAFGHASSGKNPANVTSVSWSHDCTGDDMLIVQLAFRDTDVTGISVTYNSVGMTETGTPSNSANIFTHVFKLASPSSGSNTIAASWSTATEVLGEGISVSGSDGTAGTVDSGNVGAGTSNFSTTVTLSAGDMVVGFGNSLAASGLQLSVVTGTERVEDLNIGSLITNGATNTGSGSTLVTWSRLNADQATWNGVPVNGAAVTATAIVHNLGLLGVGT